MKEEENLKLLVTNCDCVSKHDPIYSFPQGTNTGVNNSGLSQMDYLGYFVATKHSVSGVDYRQNALLR